MSMILPRMCLITVVKPQRWSRVDCETVYDDVAWGGGYRGVYVVGVQIFTVQSDATYYIYAYGAAGGVAKDGTDNAGGKGAYVHGQISLTNGDQLMFMVGQKGKDGLDDDPENVKMDNQGGGGGGTFVWKKTQTAYNDKDNSLLAAAGGGGGAGRGSDGEVGKAGNDGGDNSNNAGSGGDHGGEDGKNEMDMVEGLDFASASAPQALQLVSDGVGRNDGTITNDVLGRRNGGFGGGEVAMMMAAEGEDTMAAAAAMIEGWRRWWIL